MVYCKQLWPSWKNCPAIYLEEIRKTTEILRQPSRYPGQDSNPSLTVEKSDG